MQRQKTRQRKIVWSIDLLKMKRPNKSGTCWGETPTAAHQDMTHQAAGKFVTAQILSGLCLQGWRGICQEKTGLCKCSWQRELCVVQDGRVWRDLFQSAKTACLPKAPDAHHSCDVVQHNPYLLIDLFVYSTKLKIIPPITPSQSLFRVALWNEQV